MNIDEKIKTILAASTHTGSRVFGGATEDSGWDYLVPQSAYGDLWDVLASVNYEREDYNSKEVISYVITREGKRINFLVARSDEHHIRWERATETMKSLAEGGADFSEKNNRVAMFNLYKKS